MSSRKDTEKSAVKSEAERVSVGSVGPEGQTVAEDEEVRAVAPPLAETLAGQLKVLQAEKADLLDTLVRRQADFENYRKRVEQERREERRRGAEALVEHLLPVWDAFERALAAHQDPAYEEYRKGIELIERQLWGVLARHGLSRVESVGKKFDPHIHHAVEKVETTEHPEGTVLAELQAGFKFHEKLLRPAMVRVAVRPASEEGSSEATVN